MADEFGELAFPVPAPDPDDPAEAAGDPLLTVLGAFIVAVVNADAATAWAALSPGDDNPAVVVRFNDPNDGVFDERDLPCFFVYRQTATFERIADDWQTDRSQIVVLWIPPPAELGYQTERAPFVNAIFKALDRAMSNGAHPAWVVAADVESTLPAVFGSSLPIKAGLLKLMSSATFDKPPIVIETVDGSGPPRKYSARRYTTEAVELLTLDPATWPGVAASAMQTTVSNTDYGDNPYEVVTEG